MIVLRQRGVRHRMILAWPVFAWIFVAVEYLLILNLSVWIPAPSDSSLPPWFYANTRAALVGEPGAHPGAARPLTRINVLVVLGLWVAARAAQRRGGGGVPVVGAALAAAVVLLCLSMLLDRYASALPPLTAERVVERQPDGSYLERELRAPISIVPGAATAGAEGSAPLH
jgi:hypothetical protein